MTIGDRICQKRKETGLSQEALAERLGVSRQSVSKWERGEAVPEGERLAALAALFSVSVDWLLTGEEASCRREACPPFSRFWPWEGVRRLFRRWGWLGGLILMAYGAALVGMGLLGRRMVRSILPPAELFPEAASMGLPFFLITGAMMAVGGAFLLGGLAAALILWRRRAP